MNPTTDVAAATPTDVSNITPEQQAMLDKHAKEFSGRSSFPSIPRLEIAKQADPANEIQVGDFMLTKRTKNDAGEYETKIKRIGPEAEVTILLVKMKYAWYDQALGKFLIQTNEFNSFDKDEKILVFEEGKLTEEITYGEFKEMKQLKWQMQNPLGGSRSALKLSYIAYIIVHGVGAEGKGIAAGMNVALSSYVGMVNGKRDFKNPEQGSLMALQNATVGVAPYAYSVKLTAEHKTFTNEQSKQTIAYYRTIFTRATDNNLLEMLTNRQKIETDLLSMDEGKYKRAKESIVAKEEPVEQVKEEVPPTNVFGEPTEAQEVRETKAQCAAEEPPVPVTIGTTPTKASPFG